MPKNKKHLYVLMGVAAVGLFGIIYSLASSGPALQGNLQLQKFNLLPKCVSLTVTPQEVIPKLPNTMGITDVTATVSFSDGKNYVTTLAWAGTNGTFSQPTEVKRLSDYSFINPFIVDGSGKPASVTVKVTSIVGAQNSPACQGGVTIKTPYTPTAESSSPTTTAKPVADPCGDLKAKIDNGTATATDQATYDSRCKEKPPVVDPCVDLKLKIDNKTATVGEIAVYEKRCKPGEIPTPTPLPPVTFSPNPPTGQTPPPPTGTTPPPTSTTPPPPTTPTSEPTPPPTPPTGSTGSTTTATH